MGSPCLFMRQQALKIGYHLHTELSLGYLESKASFIDISSIASFKLFLITWLREYCTFSDSSVVSLKSWPWPKYIQQSTFSKKNHVLLSNVFSSSNMFFIRLLSKYLKKKFGGHCARLREKENLFRYLAQLEGNLLHFVRARAHVRALMTQKSCAVDIRNAILRNYPKGEC